MPKENSIQYSLAKFFRYSRLKIAFQPAAAVPKSDESWMFFGTTNQKSCGCFFGAHPHILGFHYLADFFCIKEICNMRKKQRLPPEEAEATKR